VRAVAISPDGTWLASVGQAGKVQILDAATGQTGITLTGRKGRVRAVAISPDGTWLATVDSWGRLRKPGVSGPLADVRGPQAVRDQRSGRLADQLAGQVAVHLPGARSGPADRCHTCPELLLCVRLLKLRPCIRRAGHTGLPASRLSESGRYLCVRRSPARYTQADRGVEDSGHAHGALNAPAFTGSRSTAHQPRTGQEPMSFVPIRAGRSCRSLPVTDTGRSSGLRRGLGPSMPPVAELPA